MAKTIWTIGHSNRSIEEFIKLLTANQIEELVDIRTVPKSRHNPQFNSEPLSASLREAGIRYTRLEELGGFRRTVADSPNTGWRNLSFRGYADYMQTPDFEAGLSVLERIAIEKRSAIMCAEAVPWRCHRSLVADALLLRGWSVFDIISESEPRAHTMTAFAHVTEGKLTYPPLDEKG